MIAHYRFQHQLTVRAPAATVHEVLIDLERYPSWWRQVRAVGSLGPDTALVLCRSALPYDLEMVLHAVRRDPPVLEVRIGGTIDGFARWRLTEVGPLTLLAYEQEVDAHGALAMASYLLKPLLRWNHRRMMAGFDRGLVSELSRVPPTE